MCAIPTASDGAPPVRAYSVVSPTSAASSCICASVTANPHELIFSAAAGPVPTTPAGLLIAKYTPGWSITAAIIAMTATNDSISIAP